MKRLSLTVCVAAVAAAVVLLTRPDGEPPSAAPAVDPAPHVREADCAEQVRQPIGPAAEDDLVAGPVILRGALGHSDDKRSEYRRSHGRDPGVKAGLVVEPGTEVILSIDKRDRAKASLVYRPQTRGADRVAEGDRAILFKACFDDEPTGWPGGFLLAGPRCVRVTLAVEGRSKPVRRRLGFGRGTC